MNPNDDFDGRLAAAVRPLVTEPVSGDAVRAGTLSPRHTHLALASTLAAVALVVAVVGAAALAAPRLAGSGAALQPSAGATIDGASLASVAHVKTSDGTVLVERAGGSIRLVLVRANGERIVLASKVEAVPSANDSFVSGTTVECPASTGLTQRYYVIG
jgi:hypothetical protein